MKVFEFYKEPEPVSHPEEVAYILNYLSDVGDFPIAISDKRLEILWYAFSEGYDAGFLIPEEDFFLPTFANWLSELDYEDAINMDVYGNIRDYKHDEDDWDE